jgi:prepilin-type N-terminal cleavage/methylation domain-containing protein
MARVARRCRRGFSLLELVVVLIILAILSTLAATTLKSHLDNAAIGRAYEKFVLAHNLARRSALGRGNDTDFGPITIDVHQDQLEVLGPQRKFPMPTGVQLNLQFSSRGRPRSRGQVRFAGNGTSPTYALKLESRDIWFIALGATGQCLRTSDPQFAEALLQ